MSGATTPSEWTYAEYARLPDDGNRYEVLDGEVLVTPAPGTNHQRIAAALFRHLDDYVREQGIGEVLWDLDVLVAPGQYLRPDILYVPNAGRRLLTDRGLEGVPGLMVEVVSPSSRRNDTVRKPARYGELGVPEYWAVDPGQGAILVWALARGAREPRADTTTLRWQPEPRHPPMLLDVARIFASPPRA